ncbi:MAG: hypothetical protein AABW80_04870 [Nanoarchaeota archaeon]
MWTIQVALAAAEMGYSVDFYSKSLKPNKENLSLEFYKRYSADFEKLEKWLRELNKIGKSEEKELKLEELLGKINKESLAIVLVDWNMVSGKEEKGYQGHFVVITGYDEENVYLNVSRIKDSNKDFPVKRELFDRARKAKGTDEEIVIIGR